MLMMNDRMIPMGRWKQILINVAPVIVFVSMLAGCKDKVASPHKSDPPLPVIKSSLLVTLPEYATTPAGMAVDKDGNLIVACPNFGSYSEKFPIPLKPACFLKITKDGKISKWFDCPILNATHRACPMGIDIGPDGELYVCDNQDWPTGNGKYGDVTQGRVLRFDFSDGKPEMTVVAKNISHPHGIKYRNGMLYVTVSMLPQVNRKDKLLVSAVYRFPADGKDINVDNVESDKHILETFVTKNRFCQYGASGMAFDSKGNLYVSDFGDGEIYKIGFDEDGKVVARDSYARTDHDYNLDPGSIGFLDKAVKCSMRTARGLFFDGDDYLYVADSANNAIAVITPEVKVGVLLQNGDTDGSDGKMDQPGYLINWNGKIVISCFDQLTGPGYVNTSHDSPYTIACVELDENLAE